MKKFFEKRLISQEITGRVVDHEEIQEEEDTTPSEITSNIPQEVEGFEPPQEEVIPIRWSERTRRAPNRLCLNVEVDEHSLGDLNEPTSYKAAMLDSESNKWIDAMNAEIQSIMDNMVWVLVDLPPGCKTIGTKWLFKKKTDMDGKVCEAFKIHFMVLNEAKLKKAGNKKSEEMKKGESKGLEDEVSERTNRAPDRLCLNVKAEEHSLGDLNEPTSYKAAMLDSESNKWIDAMNAEIQSMMDNMVWVLVDLPPGCKTVGNKWIFKKKTDMDGIVYTYKARLVAKSYTQLYRVNYEETFLPVADIKAIRILMSIAAFYDYEIWQMDVKTDFLNGYLDEDIYMVQPEGFVDPNHLRKVCKLQRSIYGLKQASRRWNKRFDEEIKRFGFDQNLDEPCVYQKASGSNVTFLILYVDDIIIMGNHIPSLQSVKDYLGKCFSMKDLGEAALFLESKSIEIDQSD
ncbi:retrotransposon protein, putative, ty1-copia subclass [Tanacetum coccineum]